MDGHIKVFRELLRYDPETGHLYWKKRPKGGRGDITDPIGAHSSTPYIQIGFDYKVYLVHRVIFAIMAGRWAYEVDHINKNKRDNRWVNLREVLRSENIINIGLKSNNTSGHVGVSRIKISGRWIAKVKVDGREISRSSNSKEVAIQYRKDMEQEYYGGYGS